MVLLKLDRTGATNQSALSRVNGVGVSRQQSFQFVLLNFSALSIPKQKKKILERIHCSVTLFCPFLRPCLFEFLFIFSQYKESKVFMIGFSFHTKEEHLY